ncbi:MAG: CTP-dependent riboflavin kinase [Candidatus Brockarchaeota archaeon]|nr:CTP-dependent riboflavin kinase [Candidatus Brockarchaeota archaeon]MBO3809339.1 CTP-dependent riboflavin kinase [Candidatus Brockarchaeota archaeon]
MKEYRKMFMLIAIAKLAGEEKMPVSTRRLSKATGVSRQSVSRYLKQLEEEGLVETVMTPRGRVIKLSSRGLSQIKRHAGTILSLINRVDKTYVFTGKVFTGLGEGAYYVSRKPYLEQFYSKLGFYPYPGTLNLRIEQYMDQLLLIEKMAKPPIFIQGFTNHERTFGDGYCYPVIVCNSYEGAIVKALRTVYDSSVVEIISPHNLRKELKLKDGDTVTFSFKNVETGRG